MKSQIFCALLIALLVSACNNTFEVGLEHVPTDTAIPPVTTSQPLSPAVPSLTETQVLASLPATHTVQIFLIAMDDNGQTGIPVGCGDSAVSVQVEIPPTQGVLKAALVALLSVRDQYYGQSGLYNALYQSDLQVESVSIDGGMASVYLTGSLTMGGECDAPRVQAQLEQTIRQFPSITDVAIYINGQPLADLLGFAGAMDIGDPGTALCRGA